MCLKFRYAKIILFLDWKVLVTELSRVQLFATPWTVACQAPLSMEFSRQEYWRGQPFPSPGDFPDPGIEPRSPTWQANCLPSELPGKPIVLKELLSSSQPWYILVCFYRLTLEKSMSHCPFPIPGFPLPHRDDISRCWGRAGECWVWTEENIALLPICNSGQFLAKLCHPLFSLLLCFSFYAPFSLFRSWPRAETILKLYISIKLSFFLLSDILKILEKRAVVSFLSTGAQKTPSWWKI